MATERGSPQPRLSAPTGCAPAQTSSSFPGTPAGHGQLLRRSRRLPCCRASVRTPACRRQRGFRLRERDEAALVLRSEALLRRVVSAKSLGPSATREGGWRVGDRAVAGIGIPALHKTSDRRAAPHSTAGGPRCGRPTTPCRRSRGVHPTRAEDAAERSPSPAAYTPVRSPDRGLARAE